MKQFFRIAIASLAILFGTSVMAQTGLTREQKLEQMDKVCFDASHLIRKQVSVYQELVGKGKRVQLEEVQQAVTVDLVNKIAKVSKSRESFENDRDILLDWNYMAGVFYKENPMIVFERPDMVAATFRADCYKRVRQLSL